MKGRPAHPVSHTHTHAHTHTHTFEFAAMGWLPLVGSIKLQVSLAESSLFTGLFCKRDL